MESIPSFQIILMLICVALSAFFSATETALTSLTDMRVRTMVDEGVRGAKTIQEIKSNPTKLLSTILIGNNVVNIGASSLATSIAIALFGNAGVGIATGLTTLVVLVFGEVTPKSLAAENAESISLAVARPIQIVMFILTPLVFILNLITGGLIRLLGASPDDSAPAITESEIRTVLDVGHEEGVIREEEREMFLNAFNFKDSQIEQVMTPRPDMATIELNDSYDEVIEVFREYGYSRMPVTGESIDDIVGVIAIKDLTLFSGNKEEFVVSQYMKEPVFFFEHHSATKVLNDLRENKTTMGIVLDEYGGTSGLVTVEDLIEEIVGEIHDEYDPHDEEIVQISESEYLVEGATDMETVNENLGIDLSSDDYDSVGGYIMDKMGSIPAEGDVVEEEHFQLEVQEVDRNRVEKIKITLKDENN